MNKQKGFTIIELIVVIAIIAVLAAIVLVNVTQYISKGRDSAVTGNLAGILTNAAQYYDDDATNKGSYTGLCANPAVKAAKDAADAAVTRTSGKAFCLSTATQFAACASLSAAGDAFCVDQTGTKKPITDAECLITTIVCP